METALHSLLEATIIAVVTILVFVLKNVATLAITWLKVKIGDANVGVLKGLASTVVHFLQQSPAFEALDTDKKKEYAINYLTQKCVELGLPFTHDDIDKVIEEAVSLMKSELGIDLSGELLSPVKP